MIDPIAKRLRPFLLACGYADAIWEDSLMLDSSNGTDVYC